MLATNLAEKLERIHRGDLTDDELPPLMDVPSSSVSPSSSVPASPSPSPPPASELVQASSSGTSSQPTPSTTDTPGELSYEQKRQMNRRGTRRFCIGC